MTTNPTHQGPHPEHGGLETHVGTLEQCSGPDCGPLDPEDEICEAVLDLEALHTDAEEMAELDREEAELVCVDQCGFCDACGMEPFGTPAEGWREAARFLRRTPRDSVDYPGALRGARLIEDELRRLADEAQQPTAAVTKESTP